MEQQKQITVEQRFVRIDGTGCKPVAVYDYLVIKAVNTTEPVLGATLSKVQVDELIRYDTKVVIQPIK